MRRMSLRGGFTALLVAGWVGAVLVGAAGFDAGAAQGPATNTAAKTSTRARAKSDAKAGGLDEMTVVKPESEGFCRSGSRICTS